MPQSACKPDEPEYVGDVPKDDLPLTILNLRALALKRLAHMDELKRTGRWARFFQTEEAFERALLNATADADRWKQIAYRTTRPTDDAAE
jgi:hypothetical protein